MAENIRLISSSLTAERPNSPEQAQYNKELAQALAETEQELLSFAGVQAASSEAESWQRARTIVEQFKPVPWFIWRISNYVFRAAGRTNELPEGMVYGLRRLMFASASDPIIGCGSKINTLGGALKVLGPDSVAAISVIHAVCRRLSQKPHSRIWKPMLDDAIVRAQIGAHVGARSGEFGKGRGMLAGFAGRCGLAILIASGDEDQATTTMNRLASGEEIGLVGQAIYGCHPLQVSAMTLSAAGCGADASFGTVSYAMKKSGNEGGSETQQQYYSALVVIEHIRSGKISEVGEEHWDLLGYLDETAREELVDKAKKIVRRGHGWNWVI